MDIVYELGEATAKEVEARIPNPPSYSAIRATISTLKNKGYLSHRSDDLKYVYFPTAAREEIRTTAMQRLLKTFFEGSASQAMSAMLDMSIDRVSESELEELNQLIKKAKKVKSGQEQDLD